MAILAPTHVDTNVVGAGDSNARLASFLSGMKSGQEGFNQDQASRSQQALASQQAALKQQGNTADLAAAEKAATAGRSVHVGDASIGVDPQVQQQQKLMKTSADESAKLEHIWGDHSKVLQSAAEQVEAGLTGLNENSVQGDKTAVAAVTRLADGAGQRINQAQLAAMAPASMQGDATKMMNYFTGQAAAGLSDQQRQTFRNLLSSHATRIQNNYNDALDEFKQNAPFVAPTLAATGGLDKYTQNFGSQGQKSFQRIQDALKAGQTPHQDIQQSQSSPGLVAQAADKLSGLKSLLFGNKAPGGAAMASLPPAPGPASPGPAVQAQPPSFDPDSYLKGN